MDHLVASIEWREGPYLLLRVVGNEGGTLVPARLGSPAEEGRILGELAEHPDTWITNRMILFRPGPADGAGVIPITLLRPDAQRPGQFIAMRDDPTPIGFFGNILVLISLLLLLGIRQAKAQGNQKYDGLLSKAMDVRGHGFWSVAGSFVRQSFGFRPGDWSGAAAPKKEDDAEPKKDDDGHAQRTPR